MRSTCGFSLAGVLVSGKRYSSPLHHLFTAAAYIQYIIVRSIPGVKEDRNGQMMRLWEHQLDSTAWTPVWIVHPGGVSLASSVDRVHNVLEQCSNWGESWGISRHCPCADTVKCFVLADGLLLCDSHNQSIEALNHLSMTETVTAEASVVLLDMQQVYMRAKLNSGFDHVEQCLHACCRCSSEDWPKSDVCRKWTLEFWRSLTFQKDWTGTGKWHNKLLCIHELLSQLARIKYRPWYKFPS